MNKPDLIKFLLGSCCVIVLVLILLLLIKVDGVDTTVNSNNKTFKEVCKESSGLWMPKSMGMTEFRNGVSVGVEKCSGCMPDKDNMFCEMNSYIAYIKQNGFNTTGFEMGGGEMK